MIENMSSVTDPNAFAEDRARLASAYEAAGLWKG